MTTTGTRFRRVEEIIDAALERPATERDAFVREACGADAVLLDEVSALLTAHSNAGDFLETAALEKFKGALLAEGERVGHYTIIKVIGSGGGGTVYLAEQDQPRRHVALKAMHGGFTTETAATRFQQEADILARLQHPSIAHVYEAGVHDGMPFIVLEYVENATTILDAVEGKDRDERLRLFADVCDAVHAGHLKGVVHRDLKPANILVLPTGHPKIIDFGIARVEDMGAASEIAGTPPYMSPEQCTPETDVDLRSDVYSLGVVLYELVSGRLPHDVSGSPIVESARCIRETAPAPLERTVPADVRAIVARSMEKDRENRYGSAAQLGEDVRRFLRWEPVTARHASLAHHLRLLWRRRRALMLAVWLLLAVLVAAVVISSGHAFRAQEAQRREAVEAYLAHIAAADGALRLHRTSEARAHLRQASPALRGWEWELLASRLDASIASYEIPGSAHVEFDPAGDRVVLAGPGNAFSVAVFGSAKVVHQEGLHSRAWRPVYSADGRMIAFGHDDGSVSLRDARTYAAVALFKDHNAQAVQVAFRPDGKQIAACYTDGALLVWDLPSGKNVIRQSGRPADRIVYSPDGKRILVGTRDGRIVIWDAGLRKRQRTIDAHRGAVNFLAPLPADGIIVSGGDDARLALWDSNTGRRRSVHADRDARILCGELVPGGRRAVTGHSDGTLTVWDLETGLVNAVLPGHAGAVSSVAVSPDGRSIVSTGNQFVKVWNMPAPGDAPQGQYPRVVRAVAFDPAGERLAIAIWDHTVRVRSLTGAFEEYTLEGHVAAVQAVEFSPDGSALASGGNDGVRVWDLESRECRVHQPSPSGGAVVGLAFDEAGTTLAWGDWNGLACLWDVESERVTQTHQQPGPVKDVVFLPGGRLWAAVAHPGEIDVWDRASGAEVRSIRLDSRTVGGAELSRDGKRLAVAAQDRIYIYDTTTWALQARHTLDAGDTATVSWGRDDRRLAAGTASGVQILDPVSGRTVLTDPTRSWIWDLRFSPGGEQLAIGTGSYGRGYCAALCIGRKPGEAWPRPLVRKDESR